MKLIVGLGNPGKEYVQTRHNMGFIVIDKILSELKLEVKVDSKLLAAYAKTMVTGEQVIFAKPLTFMNLSGQAVINLMNYYKIEINDILIISDDTALELGRIRMRASGSHGGQNGLKHIINQLGTTAFKRLRVGIGDNKQFAKYDYVLGKISKDELQVLMPVFENCASAVLDWIKNNNFEQTMTKYNTPQAK